MLKKLRLKFILINMIIVTIMLCVIFGLPYYSTSQDLERGSTRMMENLVSGPIHQEPPNRPHENVHLPYFRVLVDREGDVIETEGSFFDLSDSELIRSIIASTYDEKSARGILGEYNLRFLRVETPMETRFVFMDMTNERLVLHNLVRTYAIVGSIAFVVFLVISIFLARWAVKPVAVAWEQQKQFVADASHELKTPLTVITTDAELLHTPDCPEADRKQLSESILTMSVQMRGLVESLLNLARIDNGSVKEEFAVVSFSNIVSDVAMIFEPVFFEKGLPLRYEIEPDIRVNGIPSHLKQLISILLDNAGKYASPGGETYACLRRSGQRRCLLEVSDQGEPIGEEERKNIFKRFYRADKARAMNHSYGLGLSIAQSVAEEHHGKIWCESRGGYNRFYVELACQE